MKAMGQTTVRAATDDDAPALARLLGELGYPNAPDALPARVRAIEAEGGSTFLALTGEHVVGLACLSTIPTLHAGGRVAYITALVTAPEARGQGIGRALVVAAERWAKERGCVRLSVTSAEHRADAHAFYPRCGLPYTGRRFSKPLLEYARGR